MQVAAVAQITIPVHFTTSAVHQSSVQKFKFPIRPPAPNHIQDRWSTLNIFQDMLGILNDCPKLNFKFYLDFLLKRDSGVPEIDTEGVELSSDLIRKAVKDFTPTLQKMKEDYFSKINANVTTQHVKLSLPVPAAVLQGPLLFICGNIPSSSAPHINIPMLADTGATNSCISLGTLLTLGYGKEDLCTEVQYLLTNVTENNNTSVIIGSIILQTEISTLKGPALLSIHFLVLNIQLEYAIIGSLELENSQSIICLSCRSICSILLHNDRFKWLSLVVSSSPSLSNPHTTKCTHSPQT